jgi:hypothetical protein
VNYGLIHYLMMLCHVQKIFLLSDRMTVICKGWVGRYEPWTVSVRPRIRLKNER